MKRLLVLLFCVPLLTQAQNKPLIEGVSPNLYITHTVQPKENYYSVGRLFNISPKEIAPFNNMQLENGLSLNQVIKVPLTAENFLQSGTAAADEVLIPVYHAVHEKEGLYRITVNYKVPLENLKQWNNIKGDAVPNGTNLIVGYLKVKKDLSALATMAKTKPADKIIPETKKETPVVTKEKEPATEKKEVAVKEKEPITAPVKNTSPAVTKETPPVKPAVENTDAKAFNGGIFKRDFDSQAKKENVVNEMGGGAIFKSNSGWQDGKYYCLHNTAPSGTIIKITSTATGKSIYAKVLDVIPDIKQNSGVLVRVSNAAAQELGVGDAKFDCTLAYSK